MKKKGRPPVLSDVEAQEIIALWFGKRMTQMELAAKYSVSQGTISKTIARNLQR